jgi:hypothetical protein
VALFVIDIAWPSGGFVVALRWSIGLRWFFFFFLVVCVVSKHCKIFFRLFSGIQPNTGKNYFP